MAESPTRTFRSGERINSSSTTLMMLLALASPWVALGLTWLVLVTGVMLPEDYKDTVMLSLGAVLIRVSGGIHMFLIRREHLSIWDGLWNWIRIKGPAPELPNPFTD